MRTAHEHLISLGACNEALEWASQYTTAQQIWDNCERADWLLWWAARTEANSHQQIVLVSCQCARRALKYVPEGEDRPRLAIEAAEAWATNPTEEAARAAARAAVWAAAQAAARTAEAAARAAEAAEAAARAAWAAEHREMCKIVRGVLTIPWVEAGDNQ